MNSDMDSSRTCEAKGVGRLLGLPLSPDVRQFIVWSAGNGLIYRLVSWILIPVTGMLVVVMLCVVIRDKGQDLFSLLCLGVTLMLLAQLIYVRKLRRVLEEVGSALGRQGAAASVMKGDPLESIASSVRAFVWLVAIASLAFSVLSVSGTYIGIATFRDYKDSRATTRVMAAAEALDAGATLTTNNMGTRKVFDSEMKRYPDWVRPSDADILLGHRILTPIKRLEPIQWRDTDLVSTNCHRPR